MDRQKTVGPFNKVPSIPDAVRRASVQPEDLSSNRKDLTARSDSPDESSYFNTSRLPEKIPNLID